MPTRAARYGLTAQQFKQLKLELLTVWANDKAVDESFTVGTTRYVVKCSGQAARLYKRLTNRFLERKVWRTTKPCGYPSCRGHGEADDLLA